MAFEYEVALSFSGAERDYVRRVAERLKNSGVSVFFDEHEEVNLWGKDLVQHLDDVYRNKAQFSVVFISKSYAERVWTNHELRSVLARALADRREYLLPVRFDDTQLSGIRSTVAFLDLRGKAPEELADDMLEKLGRTPAASVAREPLRRPKLRPTNFNPYQEGLDFIARLRSELSARSKEVGSDDVSCSTYESAGRTCIRIVWHAKTVYSLDVWMGGIIGGASLGFYGIPGESRGSSSSSNAWADFENSPDGPLVRFHDLSLLGHLGGDRTMPSAELVDAIWDRICDALERASER